MREDGTLKHAEAMNVELSEEDLPLIRRALEHYHAYTCAVQREDGRYKMLAERLSAPQRKFDVGQAL